MKLGIQALGFGPKEHIVERLQAWKAAGQKRFIDTMMVMALQPEPLEVLAEELL